ncbi:MAG: DUF4160 domain-containing protein [Bdellovibrio sp.]|nr:DUF4160 domain-containing protein [Bdellovibrio sp.]
MSPTVIILEGYRFFFFSEEGNERPHIHVKKENRLCKFWISPKIKLAKNTRFKDFELKRIEAFVLENQKILLRRWYEYFHTRRKI